MDTFLGKEVTVVRDAEATDNGFDASRGKQIVIRWIDGSEKTVLRSEVKHTAPKAAKKGQPLPKTHPPVPPPPESQPKPIVQAKDQPAKYRGIDVTITRTAGQGDFTLGAEGKLVPFDPALGPQVMIRVPPDGLEQCVLRKDCVVA